MLRNFLAVVAGYAVMAVFTMAITFGLVIVFPEYRQAGEQGVAPPTAPIVINLALGGVGAALGGFVCALIARNAPRRTSLILAVLVFIMGAVYAMSMKDGPQPLWYLIGLPIVGSLGVAAGGLLRRRKPV